MWPIRQMGASRDDGYHVDPFDVDVGCGDDQVPAGMTALGPAVTFGPEHLRFLRELSFTIPVRLSLLPEGGHRGHVEVTYTGGPLAFSMGPVPTATESTRRAHSA